MRVAIVGSRGFRNLGLIHRYLQCLMQASGEEGAAIELVSGGARGPDAEAGRFARENGVPITVHKADWSKHGMQAGFVRNADIVADTDLVMAFWDGSSHGTKDMMDRTLAARKTLYVFFDSLHG